MRFPGVGDVPIRYFFCDDDTPFLPFLNAYNSRNWLSDKDREYPAGEVKGAYRKWVNGSGPGCEHCDGVKGDAAAWIGDSTGSLFRHPGWADEVDAEELDNEDDIDGSFDLVAEAEWEEFVTESYTLDVAAESAEVDADEGLTVTWTLADTEEDIVIPGVSTLEFDLDDGWSINDLGGSKASIVMGTLPAAKGGTGVNSIPDLYDLLAIDAAILAQLDAFIGNTGITTVGALTAGTWLADVIGPSKGGTGVTSLLDLRSALAIDLVENTALSTFAGNTAIASVGTITTGVWQGTAIAIAKGGTGGTSAATAKANLSLDLVENTALSTWTGNTAIVSVGTITTGVWNGTAIGLSKGGTGGTDAATARAALGLNAANLFDTVQPLSSITPGPVPQWGYVDVSYTSFNVASTSGTFNAYSQVGGCAIMGAFAKLSTKYLGGAISACVMDLGYSATPTTFITAYQCFSTVSDTNFSSFAPTSGTLKDWTAATNVQVKMTSSGALLNALTQGVVRVFICVAKFN